jgi:hypothetical protein
VRTACDHVDDQVRLVSWNCCDGFERKSGHLERLHPDIAVVSECRPECLGHAGLSSHSFWIGDPGHKGLAVICYNGWRIGELGPPIAQKWFAPLKLTKGEQVIQLVGVWLNEGDYVQPTIAAWKTLCPFIEKGPTILAGDFNQSVVFDKGKAPGRRFADVLKLFDETSLVSAWHDSTGESHGRESQATLHWRWQEWSRFHIDDVFYPPKYFALRGATLGAYNQYVAEKISDHVPLAVDLDFIP